MMQPRRDSFNDDVEEEEEERREAEILAALEAPEPPAEEVVARMHRELLVALAMPDAKLEELTPTEPVEKKWAVSSVPHGPFASGRFSGLKQKGRL